MTSEEMVALVVDALHDLKIPYMIVGSLSSSYYGISRSTNDADFVLSVESGSITRLTKRLEPTLRIDPQMAFETVTASTYFVAFRPNWGFKIEFFLLSDDPHNQARFARRRQVRLYDRDVFMPTAEDVVIQKLRWAQLANRRKDVDDVLDVMTVQGNRLDWGYIEGWCDRHGSRPLLETIRASLPRS